MVAQAPRTTWKTPERNYTGTVMAIMFFFLGALWFFLFVPLATSIPSATAEAVARTLRNSI